MTANTSLPTPQCPSRTPCRTRSLRRTALLLGAILAASGTRAADPAREFTARCRDLAGSARERGHAVVEGRDGWLFLTSELRHLGAGPFWGDAAATASSVTREDARDPLPVIIETAEMLRAQGATLLLMPVPPRAVVYADKLWPEAPGTKRLDHDLQAFYHLLEEAGVPVLDLTDTLRAARATDARDGPVYCRQDSHWSPRGIALAADALAERLRELLPETLPPAPPASVMEPHPITIRGDLWRLLDRPDLPREEIPLLPVATPPPPADGLGEVLLLADSHGLVFHAGGDLHAEHSGLPDHLAARLAHPVTLLGRRGSAATAVRIDLARRVRANPAAADRIRVVVWCFAAREFTESAGWRSVPIFP